MIFFPKLLAYQNKSSKRSSSPYRKLFWKLWLLQHLFIHAGIMNVYKNLYMPSKLCLGRQKFVTAKKWGTIQRNCLLLCNRLFAKTASEIWKIQSLVNLKLQLLFSNNDRKITALQSLFMSFIWKTHGLVICSCWIWAFDSRNCKGNELHKWKPKNHSNLMAKGLP